MRELLRAGSTGDAGAAALPQLGDRVVRRVARVAPDAPALAEAVAVLGDGQPLALAAGWPGSTSRRRSASPTS